MLVIVFGWTYQSLIIRKFVPFGGCLLLENYNCFKRIVYYSEQQFFIC